MRRFKGTVFTKPGKNERAGLRQGKAGVRKDFWRESFFLEREREREIEPARLKGGGTDRGKERESQAGSMLSVQSPAWGSIPQTARSLHGSKLKVRRLTH